MSEEERTEHGEAGGPAPTGAREPGAGGPDPLAPEVSQRVGTILDAVEREAERLRLEAREEARRYLEYSRRRADALVEERQRRIAALSDELLRKTEAVVARLDDATPVRHSFDNLVRALGGAAERLAREVEETRADFDPPSFGEAAASEGQRPPAAAAAPPAPQPARAPAAEAPPAPTQAVPAKQPAPPTSAGRPSAPATHPQPPATPGATPAPPERGRELDATRLVAIQMAAAGSTRAQVRDHLRDAMGSDDAGRMLDEIFGPGSGDDARVPWTAFGHR